VKKKEERFARGLALFNAGKFFEAHEAWEELWLGQQGSEKTFLQGLIQVAGAFHHAQHGNTRGKDSLLEAGLTKLSQFPADHSGIAVAKLCENCRQWNALAGSTKEVGARQFPQISYAVKNLEAITSAAAKRKRAPRRRNSPQTG
jgi:uncharacterized protein